MRHKKTDLKVFVVVIPKAWPCPSFFWYDTDFSEFDSIDIIDYILEKSVSYQKKDGHDNDKDLLKGLFSRDACQLVLICIYMYILKQCSFCS